MKKAAIIFLVLMSCFVLHAQTDTAYIYTYGGVHNEGCNQVEYTMDGGYIMVGTTNSFGYGNTSVYAIKTDSLCNHKWSGVYGGTINQAGYSVTQTYDKGFAFLGFTDSYGYGGYDVFLVKTDSLGKVKWQKTYGGSDWDFGYSIKQTPIDSGFILCGLTYSYGSGNGDVYVIKTDKNGDTLWTRTLGGVGYDVGNCVYVHEDSLYVIAGSTTSFGNGDTDSYFIEIDNKGIIERTRTYGITKNDGLNSVRGTSDNGFIMYGSTDSIPDSTTRKAFGELMIKTDSAGNLQWMQVYNVIGLVRGGKDVMQLQNGSYLSVGTEEGGGLGGNSMHIQRTAIGGWFQAGPAFGGAYDEFGNSIAHGNGKNVVFTGATDSYGAGSFDFYAVRFANDSIIQNYALSMHNFMDTLSPAGVSTVNAFQEGIKVFPNPMVLNATVLVQGRNGDHYSLSLFDETGKCLQKKLSLNLVGHDESSVLIERNNLNSGVYTYQILNNQNKVIGTGKLIIE